MASGPSKQELEMYWQNSRPYFDELARHYQQADPQYYKEYIEPFYTNPFRGTYQAKQSRGGAGKAIIVMVAILVLGIAGAASFMIFYLGSDDTSSKELEKIIKDIDPEKKTVEKETSTEKETTKNDKDKQSDKETSNDPDERSDQDHFIEASKQIAEKDYDKAEYHLKKVKKGSEYYEQAQQLLKNMKFLRQYNK